MPEKKILKDGEKLRVDMMLMDSLQRDVHERYGSFGIDDAKRPAIVKTPRDADVYPAGPGIRQGGACTTSNGYPGAFRELESGDFKCVAIRIGGEDAMTNDNEPTKIVDGFGNAGLALQRPGARYITAGKRTVDHALQVARAIEREQAFADSIAGDTSPNEVARIHNTGDARTDAYLDQVHDFENAWKGSAR
jgi:hypothetical protein